MRASVARNLPPSQLGGPGKPPLSAWFSAAPGGLGRASWSAYRGESSACFCSARRRPCQGDCPVRLAVLPRSTKAVCGGGGSDQSQLTVANGKHAIRQGVTGTVVTNDEAENAPRLRVANGEDSQESKPPLERRVETHTAKAHNSSTPVPWRWRSRPARISGHIDRRT